MYANIVSVEISDMEAATRNLHEEIVPLVKQAPGFVAGYWLTPKGNEGRGIIFFESEEAALRMAEMARSRDGGGAARIVDIETRKVMANA